MVVAARAESGEDDEDDGRDEERVCARPLVREETESELANDLVCVVPPVRRGLCVCVCV